MGKVIKGVVLTEKSVLQMQVGKYCFKVERHAKKPQIAIEVERDFGVKVESVNICRVPSGTIRRGRITGTTPSWKKAVVTLKKGQQIAALQLENKEEKKEDKKKEPKVTVKARPAAPEKPEQKESK